MRRLLALGGLAAALVCAPAAHAVTVPVTGFGLVGWNKGNTLDSQEALYVAGPTTARGSLQLTTGEKTPAAQLRTATFNLTQLSSITELRYATFSPSSSGLNSPYLAIQVDLNGDALFDDSLVFEPGMQPGGIVKNAWQTHQPLAGRWFSTRGNAGMPMSSPGTFAQYVGAFPGARIVGLSDGLGGIGLIVGDSNNTARLHGYVDYFHIRAGTAPAVTYDFGPLG